MKEIEKQCYVQLVLEVWAFKAVSPSLFLLVGSSSAMITSKVKNIHRL